MAEQILIDNIRAYRQKAIAGTGVDYAFAYDFLNLFYEFHYQNGVGVWVERPDCEYNLLEWAEDCWRVYLQRNPTTEKIVGQILNYLYNEDVMELLKREIFEITKISLTIR